MILDVQGNLCWVNECNRNFSPTTVVLGNESAAENVAGALREAALAEGVVAGSSWLRVGKIASVKKVPETCR
jgi:hypothetical protein